MDQITINKDILEDKIHELEKLRDKFNDHTLLREEEEKRGSGEVIDLINTVDKEQILLTSAYESLISNTIMFFKNILSSVIDADLKAESNFK